MHIPKTGGTSLLHEIRDGALGRYLLDNEDRPGTKRLSKRIHRISSAISSRIHQRKLLKEYDVIHGHFLARKYAFLYPKVNFITFLREPVARLLSGYFYMKYVVVKNPYSVKRNPRVLLLANNQLSLVEYARRPFSVHAYEKFIAGMTLDQFLLIGITERFSESIAMLNKLLSCNLTARHERSHDFKIYESEYLPWMKDLRAANKENTRIYQEAVHLFEKRLRTL